MYGRKLGVIGLAGFFIAQAAAAQDELGRFCSTLTNGRLVERTDSSSTQYIAESEMSWLCQDQSEFSERWSQSSSQLKLGWDKFSANGRGSSGSGSSTATYDQLCRSDRRSFSSFLETEYAETRFSWLQPAIESCVLQLGRSGRDIIAGTTTLDPASDERFTVRISFNFDKVRGAQLSAIQGSDQVECFSDAGLQESAIGMEDERNLVFTCTKPEGYPVGGEFAITLVSAEVRQTLPIRFDVPTASPEQRWIDGMMDQVRSEIYKTVPIGTVAAFEMDRCPNRWEPVEALAGRVIVGAGEGNGLSPRTVNDLPGGSEMVALSESQIPPHSHRIDHGYRDMETDDKGSEGDVPDRTDPNKTDFKDDEQQAVGQPHENMPPFKVLQFCRLVR